MHPVIQISTFAIPTYYLIITMVVCLCLIWIQRRAISMGKEPRLILDLSLFVMITSFTGARLFHVLYEEPQYYLENPTQIFAFWNGGFVFFGGALLTGIASFILLGRLDKKERAAFFDFFSPVLALGYSLGRVACFFAGCCYGRFCDLPWAVSGRHPTQLYATFWEAVVVVLLLWQERRKHVPGQIFSIWIFWHGWGRLMMEYFRDDFRGPTWGLSISSWISVGLILGGAFLWFRFEKKNLAD